MKFYATLVKGSDAVIDLATIRGPVVYITAFNALREESILSRLGINEGIDP